MSSPVLDPVKVRADMLKQAKAGALHAIGAHRPDDAQAIADLIVGTYDRINEALGVLLARLDLNEMSPAELEGEIERRARHVADVAIPAVSMLALDVLVIGVRGRQARTQ